jgi:hypothetical protein
VQLSDQIDAAFEVYRDVLAISILTRTICSPTRRFKNFIHINSGHGWSETHHRALLNLGLFVSDKPSGIGFENSSTRQKI